MVSQFSCFSLWHWHWLSHIWFAQMETACVVNEDCRVTIALPYINKLLQCYAPLKQLQLVLKISQVPLYKLHPTGNINNTIIYQAFNQHKHVGNNSTTLRLKQLQKWSAIPWHNAQKLKTDTLIMFDKNAVNSFLLSVDVWYKLKISSALAH